MTNKQVIALWDNFLKAHCNCYPDESGNRPCDNGTLCDQCMTPEMVEKFNLAFKVAMEYQNEKRRKVSARRMQ